jgi:hypothetical protein
VRRAGNRARWGMTMAKSRKMSLSHLSGKTMDATGWYMVVALSRRHWPCCLSA